MGARNLDRIDFECFVRHGETIGDMLRNGWKLQTLCVTCDLRTAFPLGAAVKLYGPDLVLWDRTLKCLRVGCHGRRHFEAKPAGMNHYNRLVRPSPLPDGRP